MHRKEGGGLPKGFQRESEKAAIFERMYSLNFGWYDFFQFHAGHDIPNRVRIGGGWQLSRSEH